MIGVFILSIWIVAASAADLHRQQLRQQMEGTWNVQEFARLLSPSEAIPEDRVFEDKDTVLIFGLQAKPELNGIVGEIEGEMIQATGRWPVRVGNKTIAIRKLNIKSPREWFWGDRVVIQASGKKAVIYDTRPGSTWLALMIDGKREATRERLLQLDTDVWGALLSQFGVEGASRCILFRLLLSVRPFLVR